MRRLLVALIATFLVLSAKIIADDEIIQFPDPYFKDLLINYYLYADPPIDLNKDGEIQYSEAAAYDGDLWLSFEWEHIKDITGIKAFINVKRIRLEDCPGITEIDLSGMVNLQEIIFNYNQNLEVLNISGCNNLGSIDCSDNNIKYLNAENCSKLKSIWCSINNIENLNLFNCTSLISLGCGKNNLENLLIQQCINLEGMNCTNNKLIELDFSNLTNIERITCSNNQLNLVNVRNSNNKAITAFKTYGNPNLKCITVDDPTYSMEHWKEIDEWTEFSENCSINVLDNKENIFKIFPNPANHTILIERTNSEPEDLRILDITGRVFIGYTIPFGETQIRINVSRLSAGAYIIEINNDTQSLIIE